MDFGTCAIWDLAFAGSRSGLGAEDLHSRAWDSLCLRQKRESPRRAEGR